MKKPKAGDAAPDLSVRDQQGNTVTLSALKGKKVILYFYPKDNTSGCTAEACSLRDGKEERDDIRMSGRPSAYSALCRPRLFAMLCDPHSCGKIPGQRYDAEEGFVKRQVVLFRKKRMFPLLFCWAKRR